MGKIILIVFLFISSLFAKFNTLSTEEVQSSIKKVFLL